MVDNLSLDGWFGGNEGPGGSAATVSFVPGPATPPSGGGSVELAVDSTGRASFGTAAYKGPAGVHGVLVLGQSRVKYTTEIIIAP